MLFLCVTTLDFITLLLTITETIVCNYSFSDTYALSLSLSLPQCAIFTEKKTTLFLYSYAKSSNAKMNAWHRFSGTSLLSEEDEVLIVSQDDVSLYNLDEKTKWKKGKLSLTTHYLIYCNEEDKKTIRIPLKTVDEGAERPSMVKGFLFKSDKIVAHVPGERYFKLSFKKGGMENFFILFNQMLERRTWEETGGAGKESSPAVASPNAHNNNSNNTGGGGLRKLGIAGIMEESKDMAKMSETFTDIDDVMRKASALVENINRLKRNASSGLGQAADSTAIQSIEATLGLGTVVDKSEYGMNRSRFYASLAVELHSWMTHEKNASLFGRMHLVPLVELFSLYNKARSGNLISPDDLLEACRELDKSVPKAKYKLQTLPSGRLALLHKDDVTLLTQLAPFLGPRFTGAHEKEILDRCRRETGDQTDLSVLKSKISTSSQFPSRDQLKYLNEAKAASLFQVSILDARDLLMLLEQHGYLCRGDAGFGVCVFYWNIFFL